MGIYKYSRLKALNQTYGRDTRVTASWQQEENNFYDTNLSHSSDLTEDIDLETEPTTVI